MANGGAPWHGRCCLGLMRIALLGSLLLGAGCGGAGAPSSFPTPTLSLPADCGDAVGGATLDASTGLDPVDDLLEPGRLLRRAALVLRGLPPDDDELEALDAAGDDDAQRAFVSAFVDDALQSPVFYKAMFELGSEWLHIPLIPPTADEPEYGAQQQRSVQVCDVTTLNPGAWAKIRDGDACNSTQVLEVEPWWAPGTSVTLVGSAASTSDDGVDLVEGNEVEVPCRGGPRGTCGCGPHAVRCHPDFETFAGYESFVSFNADGQRRQLAEEPARLFAHLAWFDRPLTELIAGHISVGTTNVQAAYVMQGIEGGRLDLLDDDSWWRTLRFVDAAHDPLHDGGDANAWREFDVSARNPFLLAARDTTFDPRVDVVALPGVPAAGMLTSLGFLNGYPRERLRAARALEALACESLDPPQGLVFNAYRRDPASEGSCQHCHRRIDPAAIHFKRWAKAGSAFEGFGATYLMPGVGADSPWHFEPSWRGGVYPFDGEPFAHWNRWYAPETRLTPVTTAQAAQNPEVLFIDFLPPDQTLLGQTSDGTVGPLGYAKLIIDAGAFDRCVVRQLHKAVIGRDVDVALEAGYLDRLVQVFVDSDRRVRPLVRALIDSDIFRRGL